jgi:hypothetical protein
MIVAMLGESLHAIVVSSSPVIVALSWRAPYACIRISPIVLLTSVNAISNRWVSRAALYLESPLARGTYRVS